MWLPQKNSPECTQALADPLNGLALACAFRKLVLEDTKVAALGRRLAEKSRGNSDVFSDGKFPGACIDYHWPLDASAETIAYAFVRLPILFLDKPLPRPSELETEVSELLADRIGQARWGI